MSADAVDSPDASSSSVRVVERVASTARPSAPPTCWPVFTSPEASPESLSVALDMARVMSEGNDRPAPMPIKSIDGRTSVT